MKKNLLSRLFFVGAVFGILFIQSPCRVSAQTTGNPVLILYDSHPGDPIGKLGGLYAIMLSNLLGHFDLKADLEPIEDYTAGKIDAHETTFYLGSYYDNPIPDAFFDDVKATAKRIVWFKYNIWQAAWDADFGFAAKYGFTFNGVRGLDGTPTATSPSPGFFDTVLYKGKSFAKYYSYDAANGRVAVDPEIGWTAVTDVTKATRVVDIKNSKTGELAPYLVRSGNFWYMADIPFSFIGARDRYVAFCDLLHDILGINHPTKHRALVRLEDVSANVNVNAMKQLSNYLRNKHIKFSVAAIPFYRDPLGKYNGGVSQEIHFNDADDLQKALRHAVKKRGSILMHGYSHQYNSIPNIHSAVSADDYEFWNAVQNTPIAEDSDSYVTGRLDAGIAELTSNNYPPFAWTTPHYQASPTAYVAFAKRFNATYQRVVYYSSDNPTDLNPASSNRDFMGGMFFPYIINSDYYGQRVIPENLGNIEYDIHTIDPTSNIVYTAQDILTNADYGLVVRDGFASFFFHPFWLEKSLKLKAFKDFKKVIKGISQMGYDWVGADGLVDSPLYVSGKKAGDATRQPASEKSKPMKKSGKKSVKKPGKQVKTESKTE